METMQDWWNEADKLKIIILLLLLSLLALFYSTLFTILKISMYNTNVQVYETVCQQIYMFNCLLSFLSNMCTHWEAHRDTSIQRLITSKYSNSLDNQSRRSSTSTWESSGMMIFHMCNNGKISGQKGFGTHLWCWCLVPLDLRILLKP